MKRNIIISLCIILLLTACTGNDSEVYQPKSSDVSLETWADLYPQQFEKWQDSVHGQAFLEGDENAPGCTDCHDDPESGEIETAVFHLDVPNRCARCHSDETMMSQYDISPDVYDTYQADYHGTTIAYYRLEDPDTHRYEAVCSDCHGSHETLSVEDANAAVHADNLLTTCQKCHHDAPTNFSTAFGHYRPARNPVSTAETPVLFWVKLFYQALIPLVLIPMAFFIVLDVSFRLKERKNHDE